MIFVMGGDGFVGSAFVRFCSNNGLEYSSITRTNYNEFIGKSCNTLINANGNSKKYIAETDPVLDFDLSVSSVQRSLFDFKYQKYVYLSSGDVYPDQSCVKFTSENHEINRGEQSNYGFNKLLAEELVKKYAKDWIIFRMGGFVGYGLKKNAVYDIESNQKIWISQESELQFLNTDSASSMIMKIIEKNITGAVINIGGHGVVKIKDILDTLESSSVEVSEANTVKYELNLEMLETILPDMIPHSRVEVFDYLRKSLKNKLR